MQKWNGGTVRMWKHLISRRKRSVSESTQEMSVVFPVTFTFMKTWCWALNEMKTGNQDCDVTVDTTAMSLFTLASLLLPPRWCRSCRRAEKVSVSALVSDQKKFKQKAKQPQSCLQKVTSLFYAAAASRWLKYKQEECDQSKPPTRMFLFCFHSGLYVTQQVNIPGSILEGDADPFGAALGSKNSFCRTYMLQINKQKAVFKWWFNLLRKKHPKDLKKQLIMSPSKVTDSHQSSYKGFEIPVNHWESYHTFPVVASLPDSMRSQ